MTASLFNLQKPENYIAASAYIAAMIDGEGSVLHTKRGDKMVMIYNSETSIIEQCVKMCNVLGIKAKVYDTKRQCTNGTFRHLRISSYKDLLKLYNSAGDYMCDRKKDALADLIYSYKYHMAF